MTVYSGYGALGRETCRVTFVLAVARWEARTPMGELGKSTAGRDRQPRSGHDSGMVLLGKITPTLPPDRSVYFCFCTGEIKL